MTAKEREEIFSKEVLRIEDIERLHDMSYNDAAGVIRAIKLQRKCQGLTVRDARNGYVHIMDYIEYFQIPNYRAAIIVQKVQPVPNGRVEA